MKKQVMLKLLLILILSLGAGVWQGYRMSRHEIETLDEMISTTGQRYGVKVQEDKIYAVTMELSGKNPQIIRLDRFQESVWLEVVLLGEDDDDSAMVAILYRDVWKNTLLRVELVEFIFNTQELRQAQEISMEDLEDQEFLQQKAEELHYRLFEGESETGTFAVPAVYEMTWKTIWMNGWQNSLACAGGLFVLLFVIPLFFHLQKRKVPVIWHLTLMCTIVMLTAGCIILYRIRQSMHQMAVYESQRASCFTEYVLWDQYRKILPLLAGTGTAAVLGIIICAWFRIRSDIADKMQAARSANAELERETERLNRLLHMFLPEVLVQKAESGETADALTAEPEEGCMLSAGFSAEEGLHICIPLIRQTAGWPCEVRGDSIGAFWPGRPDCGLQAVQKINRLLQEKGLPELTAGVVWGMMRAGTTGDDNYRNVVLFSEDMIFAEYLKDMGRRYEAATVMTRELAERIQKTERLPAYRSIGYIYAAYKKQKTEVLELIAGSAGQEKRQTRMFFEKGLALYMEDRCQEARRYFIEVIKVHREDLVARRYLALCDHRLKNRQGEHSIYIEVAGDEQI